MLKPIFTYKNNFYVYSINTNQDKSEKWSKIKFFSSTQVDTYIDIDIPYVDAKAAAALCVQGPCKYVIKDGYSITKEWIEANVTPSITHSFRNLVPLLGFELGKALLYAVMEDCYFVCPVLKREIRNRYLSTTRPNGNPIKKVPIVVSGNEGTVYLDEIIGTF